MSSRAARLGQFTDLLNKYGPDSPEVREFRALHQADSGLLKLFDTAVRLQSQLRAGKLDTKTNELVATTPSPLKAAISSAPSASPREGGKKKSAIHP
jgi:hypothetical protein